MTSVTTATPWADVAQKQRLPLPILNPITGKEHRPRMNIVDGFEYVQAEIGRKLSG